MFREHRRFCNWLALIVLLLPLSAHAYFLEDSWEMHKESDTITDGKRDPLIQGEYSLYFRGMNKGEARFSKKGYTNPLAAPPLQKSGHFRLYDKYIILTRGTTDAWGLIGTEQQACIIVPAADKKSMTLSGCDFAGTWIRASEVAAKVRGSLEQGSERGIRTFPCDPYIVFMLLVFTYFGGMWLLAREFTTRCLVAFGKPYPRFMFGFTFFRPRRGDLSGDMRRWGMTDEDMKIVIAYREKWKLYMIALVAAVILPIMLVAPIILQAACRS